MESAEQELARVKAEIAANNIEMIRFNIADQHGVLRGKAFVPSELETIVRNGCTMPSSLLLKDTSHRTAFPVWNEGAGIGRPEFSGAADVIMHPDLSTFRILPWAANTASIQCDLVGPDGEPNDFDTRNILRMALQKLNDAGFDYRCGLEIECSIFRLADQRSFADTTQPNRAPDVRPVTLGYQYLTDSVLDEFDDVYQVLRRDLVALGLPLRSMEVEFGPSQCELTFGVTGAMQAADDLVALRAAVRQICRRHGYHASFMCRPALPNVMSNGWHLHQSLVDLASGDNVFMPTDEADMLSEIGLNFVAGILEHAEATCVFSTPTINGYKRFSPHTLAPDRLSWGKDNRGAMLRVLGSPGDPASRIENRVGEPAANPYLFIASQILAGLDGIQRKLTPPPPTSEPYNDKSLTLPGSLAEALGALKTSEFYRRQLGQNFIDYLVAIKEYEIDRFHAVVTDWEHQEYFGLF